MDPERPIEKALRACADKRREQAGAPFELHPVTRKLLQDEVARGFGTRQRSGGSSWWSLLLASPRLAWTLAGAATLVVVLGLVLLLPGGKKQEQFLASNKLEPAQAPAAVPQPLPALADSEKSKVAAPGVVGEMALLDKSASTQDRFDAVAQRDLPKSEVNLTLQPAQAPANQPSPEAERDLAMNRRAAVMRAGSSGQLPPNAAPAPQPDILRRYGLAQPQTDGFAPTTLTATPAPAAATSELKASIAYQAAEPGAEALLAQATASAPSPPVAVYFADQTRGREDVMPAEPVVRATTPATANGARALSPATSVLVGFNVQQNGEQLQMIDGDGSVYSGFLQPVAADSAGAAAPAKQASEGRRLLSDRTTQRGAAPVGGFVSGQAAPTPYFFRVTGTNRSLNQKVVFSGTLLPGGNTLPNPVSTNALFGTPSGQVFTLSKPGETWLQNARISGKALVNDRQQFEVNAVPASPRSP